MLPIARWLRGRMHYEIRASEPIDQPLPVTSAFFERPMLNRSVTKQ